eukprot:jgi/Tetstr1/464599/TSEL_009354.t1
MVDVGKAAVAGVGTTVTDHDPIEAARQEYYHAACNGAFFAGSTIELRKLLAAACVTEGITHAFGQRLEAIVHSMEPIDDGHRFRQAYLRKH